MLPKTGDSIAIPAGKTVLLDTNTPALKGLSIAGTLTADPARDVSITSDYIVVQGPASTLQIGTASAPHLKKARITLTGAASTANALNLGIGTKLLAAFNGGTLELHGEKRTAWTRLNASVLASATQLTLESTSGWRAGDIIAIAPSGLLPAETETATIASISGSTVTLTKPLAYPHFGEKQVIAGFTVENRAEVGLLSRNVVVEGDSQSDTAGFGGQIRVATGGTGHIEGVELSRMGQKALLGMYALHFHQLGASGLGQYLKNSAIHDSYNRCVTIHGTNKLLIEDNVTKTNIGHCFFVEDGNELDNQLIGNLVLDVQPAKPGEEVLTTDIWPVAIPSDQVPAAYWISHPSTVLRNNVSAGVTNGWGFRLTFRPAPTGLGAADAGKVFPRKDPFAEFSGNLVHSTMRVSRGIDYDLNGTAAMQENYDGAQPALWQNFTAYNNDAMGMWFTNTRVVGAKIVDQMNGVLAQDASIEDSLFAARTKNDGMMKRSFANPFINNFRRVAFNQGLGNDKMKYTNVTLANYDCASCYDVAFWMSFGINRWRYLDTVATVKGLKFVNTPLPLQVEMYGPFYESAPESFRVAWAVVHDLDGSLTGTGPGSLVYNNSSNLPAACTPRPNTKFATCPVGVEPPIPPN